MPSKRSPKKTVAKKKGSARKKVAKTKRGSLEAVEEQTELLPTKPKDTNQEAGQVEMEGDAVLPGVSESTQEDAAQDLGSPNSQELVRSDYDGTAEVNNIDHFTQESDSAGSDNARSSSEDSLSDTRIGQAQDFAQGGRIADAIELYRDILTDSPRNVKVRNDLGVLYDKLGHSELALEQFELAESIEPQDIEVLINYGTALGALTRYGEAEGLLLQALAIDPGSVAVRTSIGILNFRRGAYAEAESELRWVCQHDSELPHAFYYYGETLNRLGRFDEAFIALERAIILQPKNARAFYTLGHLYDRKHMTEEAALMYRKARRLRRN